MEKVMINSCKLKQTESIQWYWLGSGTRKGQRTYYDYAQVVHKGENKTRVFQTGNAVHVAGEEGQIWIGQIVNMFHAGTDIDDDECVVVETPVETLRRMRCSLRWFYNADDETISDSRRVSPHIPPPIGNELYFSDLVEEEGTNCLEVVEGRAFLYPTEQHMVEAQEHPPSAYWEGDIFRLVRCFYGNNAGRPPPIRQLAKGELEILLKNPSDEADLYDRARLFLYGPSRAVLKGTGRKKRFQCLPKTIDSSPVRPDEISARSSNDPALRASEICPVTSVVLGEQQQYATPNSEVAQKPQWKRSVLDSCPVLNFHGIRIPPMIQNELANTFGMGCKTGQKRVFERLVQRFELPHSLDPQTPSLEYASRIFGDVPTLASESRTAGDQAVDLEPVVDGQAESMANAWAAVTSCMAEGTQQQKETCIRNLPNVLSLFREIMEDKDLDFTMCKDSTKIVAQIASQHIPSTIAPSPSFNGCPPFFH